MEANTTAVLSERVVRAAERMLEVKGYVSPIGLLVELGWLHPSHVRYWEKGGEDCLEASMQSSPKKRAQAFELFTGWAKVRELVPVEATLRTSSRDAPLELRVMSEADPEMEAFFRTYYAPSDITPRKLEALKKKLNKPPDLVVFMTVADDTACAECQAEIPRSGLLFREKEQSLCLRCADLDHLEFLPGGDAALSRRSRKYSPLSAVVVEFNRRAKRYERRGILVTSSAIERAEKECLSDADQRAARRERSATYRDQEDARLVEGMAAQIHEQFPGCPAGEAREISLHTARRGTGRVGRSAAGRKLHPDAIRLAVSAHVRHAHTDYDALLMTGTSREDARRRVASRIDDVLTEWERSQLEKPP